MGEGKENRPIINKDEPFKEIEKLLRYREPYYKSSAEFIVDTTEKSIERIVDEILTQTKLL